MMYRCYVLLRLVFATFNKIGHIKPLYEVVGFAKRIVSTEQ